MKRCGMCGSTKIDLTDIKGRKFAWMDYPSVELRFEQIAPVCSECKTVMLRTSDSSKLDANIVRSIQTEVNEAILYLTEELGLTQEHLAKALGITPQYLSMVKARKKKLSFTAFSLLIFFKDYPGEIEKRTGVKVPNFNSSIEYSKTFISSERYHATVHKIWSNADLRRKTETVRIFDFHETDPSEDESNNRTSKLLMGLTARGTYGKI